MNQTQNNIHYCEYGCGNIANYQLSNGKWCCSPHYNKCPNLKKKNSKSIKTLRKCPFCNIEFLYENSRDFSNHVKWCKNNPDLQNYKNIAKKTGNDSILIRYGELKDFEVECFICKKHFYVREREKSFPKKKRYFCSSKCAHEQASRSHIHLRKNHLKMNNEKLYEQECVICHRKFLHKTIKKTCSKTCNSILHRNKIKESRKIQRDRNNDGSEETRLKIYKSECNFTFSLKKFPDEFDFDLIKKYGWYKAKNHGNNLNGISRDHMFSVMEGFRQNIDPKIISHPANCKLVRHNDNVSKRDKCSITLDDLLKRIEEWNKKYNL